MVKNCETCGKEYKVKPSDAEKSRYCSKECRAEGHRITFRGSENPNYKNAGQRTCQYCGQQYLHYSKVRKYCSKECAIAAHAAPNKSQSATPPLCACGCGRPVKWSYEKQDWRKTIQHEGIQRKNIPAYPKRPIKVRLCIKCDRPIDTKSKRYCWECSPNNHRGELTTICTVCGESYHIAPSQKNKKLTCSNECSRIRKSERQKGEKSHLWQGGKTKETIAFRGTYHYGDWRKEVFQRDNYTCQMCGKVGTRLAAHHIKLLSLRPELALDVTNGITLCWPCHRSIKSKEAEYEDRFYAITKRPGNTPTEAQKRFMEEWVKHGGIAVVASSLEDVQKVI